MCERIAPLFALVGSALAVLACAGAPAVDREPAPPADAPQPSPPEAPAKAPDVSTSERDDMVELLRTIDGGRHPAAAYAELLDVVHARFPGHSATSLGDMAAKAKELCAGQGHRVDVIAPLYAIKNATDGFEGEAFDKMFANNPPPTLLALWVATGCE
jgi:hypothetical protein